MIAARWAVLFVAALGVLAAFGVNAHALQPSALRVTVTAALALLAPLFWPGCAATRARTALRVVAWSAAVTCLAAAALRMLGDPAQALAQMLGACTVLMPVLLSTHALAAGLEALLARRQGASDDARSAREIAGRAAATVLAVLGSLPLWLGPTGELLAGRHPWLIDAIVGASPLTHLAVASGNDLLRNPWFYQHSNLAALQFSYPGMTAIAASYAAACVALALVAFASSGPRRPGAGATTIHLEREQP